MHTHFPCGKFGNAGSAHMLKRDEHDARKVAFGIVSDGHMRGRTWSSRAATFRSAHTFSDPFFLDCQSFDYPSRSKSCVNAECADTATPPPGLAAGLGSGLASRDFLAILSEKTSLLRIKLARSRRYRPSARWRRMKAEGLGSGSAPLLSFARFERVPYILWRAKEIESRRRSGKEAPTHFVTTPTVLSQPTDALRSSANA